MTLVIVDLGGTPSGLIRSALDRIPSPRREEICRLKGELARAQRVVGEALVRRFALEFGLTCPTVLRKEKRKPYLAEAPGLCFNLSHSGEAVVFAAAGSPVGADVEKVVPRDFSTVAARCFSSAEQKKIARSEAPLIEFYRLWTRRESIVKRRGEGSVRGVNVSGERVRSFALSEGKLIPFGAGAPQYVLSVCLSPGEKGDLSVRFCSADEVLENF